MQHKKIELLKKRKRELNKTHSVIFSLTIKMDCCKPFVIIPKNKNLDDIENLVRKRLQKRMKHLMIGKIANNSKFGLCTTNGVFLRSISNRVIEANRKKAMKNDFTFKIGDDADIEKHCGVVTNQTLLWKRYT